MTQVTFDKLVKILDNHADKIIERKRPDYTQENEDVLHNFKRAAEEAGITPLQVWLVHFHKQYSAVARFMKNPSAQASEPTVDRFADLRNYLQLGYALLAEHEGAQEE